MLKKDIITGITLFFSCYYVLSANPTLLSSAGVPASSVLLGTLIVIILGNLSGAIATNTGLIIAPALGISAFFANYIENAQGFDWTHGLIVSAVSGLLIIITSFCTDWRNTIVNHLPEPVTIGIKATIGSILVGASFGLMDQIIDNQLMEKRFIVLLMAMAVLITICIIKARQHYKERATGWVLTFLSLEHLIAVIFVTSTLYLMAPEVITSYPESSELSFIVFPSLLETRFTFSQLMTAIPLVITLWFIIITDIPGTPPAVLPKKMIQQNEKRYVNRGFKNDSIFTFLSPLLGTTSTIYYAENQLLTENDRYTKTIGLTVSFLFLVCLLILLGSQFTDLYNISLQRIIPPLAVAPVLLYIGLFVIANSFISSSTDGTSENSPNNNDALTTKGFRYYLPAALAVVLTPKIGPEYSLPITILSYWLTRSYRREKTHISFKIISGGACFTLFVYFALLVSNDEDKSSEKDITQTSKTYSHYIIEKSNTLKATKYSIVSGPT
ncbi:MAG: solute carrier family 23 protein [Cellvibrionaceae bacterium]